MKLINIFIHNFLSVGEIHFKLNDRGILLIEGQNLDTSAANSNGAGKSSLFEAITWCLWGLTMRGLNADDVVNNKKLKNCVVSLMFEQNGEQYVVQRHRKHNAEGNELLLLGLPKDGMETDLRGATSKDTQEKINALINLDYQTFTNSLMFGQDMSGLFSQLSDREQKAILERVLGIEQYNKAQEAAKLKKKEHEELLVEVKTKHQGIEALKSSKTDELESYNRAAERFEGEKQQEIDQLQARIQLDEQEMAGLKMEAWELEKTHELRENQVALDELLTGIKGMPNIKEKVDEKQERLKALDREVRRRDLDERSHQTKSETLLKEIETLENAPISVQEACETCERAFDKEHIEQYRDSVKARHQRSIALKGKTLQELQEAIEQNDFQRRKHTLEIAKVNKELSALAGQLDAYTEATNLQHALTATIRVIKGEVENASRLREQKREGLIKSIGVLKVMLIKAESSTNMWTERAHRLKETISELTMRQEGFTEDMSNISKELDLYQFWVEGFGNQGLKSFILDGVVPILNEKANEYSKILSDGDIHIKFNTQTTLKSGEYRDKFEVSAINLDGADVYKGNSSGEKRRIDLCVMFALHHLVRTQSKAALNVMFMDEIFDSLDSSGAERVIQLLQSEMSDKDSVFVITHNPELRQYFDKSVTVVKEKGITRLEES